MKKLLVYPFNRDFLPVLHVSDRMKEYAVEALVSPGGFGLLGQKYQCGERNWTVISDFSEALSSCDAVLLAECWFPIDYQRLILPKIREAAACGKKVLCSETYFAACETWLVEESLLEAVEVLKSPEYMEVDPFILKMNVPVAFILGSMQNTGKFETAVRLKQEFEKRGYRVSLIGSRSESLLFGDVPFPQYLFDSHLTEMQKIYSFSRIVKNIELKEKPDLILLGIPGAVLPYSQRYVNDFGFLTWMVSYAVPPDIAVLCSLCPVENNNVMYFDHMEKSIENHYDIPVCHHFASPYTIDALATETEKNYEYLSLNDMFLREKLAALDAKICDAVGDYEGIVLAVNKIVRELS